MRNALYVHPRLDSILELCRTFPIAATVTTSNGNQIKKPRIKVPATSKSVDAVASVSEAFCASSEGTFKPEKKIKSDKVYHPKGYVEEIQENLMQRQKNARGKR